MTDSLAAKIEPKLTVTGTLAGPKLTVTGSLAAKIEPKLTVTGTLAGPKLIVTDSLAAKIEPKLTGHFSWTETNRDGLFSCQN